MNKHYRLYRRRFRSFSRSERGKTTGLWARRVLNTIIFVWLFYELTKIGWGEIAQSLPTQFWFYVLFLIGFFQLPLFEIWIYRITWAFRAIRSFPIFLIKKVYNKDVLGYSGELYFYLWARQHLRIDDREIFMIIKDNNIISSVASTLVAITVVAVLLFTGQIVVVQWLMEENQLTFLAGITLALVMVVLFIRFRHLVITMKLRDAYKIFTIHLFRLVLLKVLNILMYIVVLPDVPLSVWFTLLAIEIILTRIPFLPNRDLIFVGLSVALAEGLMVSQTDLAGIMVAKAALGKLLNVAAFGLAAIAKKSAVVPKPETSDLEEKDAP